MRCTVESASGCALNGKISASTSDGPRRSSGIALNGRATGATAGSGNPRGFPASVRLRVDPLAHDGIGLCEFLAANAVGLYRPGYPIVMEQDLQPDEVRPANRAAKACTQRALLLARAPTPAPPHPAWSPTSAQS